MVLILASSRELRDGWPINNGPDPAINDGAVVGRNPALISYYLWELLAGNRGPWIAGATNFLCSVACNGSKH
jgi:hypothetical protein